MRELHTTELLKMIVIVRAGGGDNLARPVIRVGFATPSPL
jgi:hypothetical protein